MPLSPDGRKLAYTARSNGVRKLWVRDMDTLESRVLAGTDRALSPFWSPDSRYLAFADGNTLKRVDAGGASPPQTLCQSAALVGSGTWNSDGVILFGSRGPGIIQRVPASGGAPAPVTALAQGDTSHALPVFLPDRHHFLYLRAGNNDVQGVYVGSLDAKPQEQSSKRILESLRAAAFAPASNPSGGNLLFLRGSTLMAQPFDPRRFELSGEAVPVAEGVAQSGSAGWFSVSSTGTLAYRGVAPTPSSQLTWYDRKGNVVGMAGDPAAYADFSLSPDGTRVASFYNATPTDIWILELATGINTRLTFGPERNANPVWSSDGSRIVFTSRRDGRGDLYVKQTNGAAEERLLLASSEDKTPMSWSRDGRFVLYQANDPKTKSDIWVLPLEPGGAPGKPVSLLQAPFQEIVPQFSPDMHWISYISDESGRLEAYVRPFLASGPAGQPALGDANGKSPRTGWKWRCGATMAKS